MRLRGPVGGVAPVPEERESLLVLATIPDAEVVCNVEEDANGEEGCWPDAEDVDAAPDEGSEPNNALGPRGGAFPDMMATLLAAPSLICRNVLPANAENEYEGPRCVLKKRQNNYNDN